MANLTKQEWLALEKKAFELRKLCLQTVDWAGSGHLGGGLSVMDLLTVLYHKYLRIKVDEPKWEDRDRFILSKGHAAIAYAPVLCDKGFNDPEMLKTFNLSGSMMGMHLDSNKVVGVDASTGSATDTSNFSSITGIKSDGNNVKSSKEAGGKADKAAGCRSCSLRPDTSIFVWFKSPAL